MSDNPFSSAIPSRLFRTRCTSTPSARVLRLTWRFANSTISQRLTIYRSSVRVDFRTELD